MGGGQWLQYNINFREWAAATGLRKWREMNFSIYGRCLSHCLANLNPPPPNARNKNRAWQAKKRSGVCYPWNFDGRCDREDSGTCKFAHSCYYCKGSRRARDCQDKRRRVVK
uniref:C3H1-type domain-containing protein n=1 Tax=Amphimedon queenslandica TaxID=400682 RepID=A0A1X7VIN8_AMPQE